MMRDFASIMDIIGFNLAAEEAESIAALYTANPTAGLKMRFKSPSGVDWNDELPAVGVAALLQAAKAERT